MERPAPIATTSILLSSGIPQLDEFLGGGFEPGTSVLLVEPTGGGAEIFAKQFAAGVRETDPAGTLYLSTEEREDEVLSTMRAFALPIVPRVRSIADRHSSRLLAQEQARSHMFELKPTVELISADSRDVAGTAPPALPADGDFLGELMLPYAGGRRPTRVIVHTMDFFLSQYPENRVLDVVTAVKAANAAAGGLFLMVMSGGGRSRNVVERLERVADCFIELEFQRRGSQFEKFLVVRKLKNKVIGLGIAPYKVTRDGFELDDLQRIL